MTPGKETSLVNYRPISKSWGGIGSDMTREPPRGFLVSRVRELTIQNAIAQTLGPIFSGIPFVAGFYVLCHDGQVLSPTDLEKVVASKYRSDLITALDTVAERLAKNKLGCQVAKIYRADLNESVPNSIAGWIGTLDEGWVNDVLSSGGSDIV